MKVTSIRCLCFVVVVIAILAVSPVVNGQRNFDDVEIVTTQLDDNLYYLQGAGGQIGVLACSALGFLDSGLTVFASTLPRRVKPIPSWNSPRLLMAYAAFFFDVVVSIFSSRFIASRSLGRCR